MASKTMHHVVIGSDTYEIVDEQGRANIAPPFSTSTAYAAGDYVIYSGTLYQFTAAHAAGAWTGTDAEETTVTENLGGGSGDGLTESIKLAMLQIAQNISYLNDDDDYYQNLYDALYPPADLLSISAVYTQSGTVYDTNTLDSLKPNLVVTAHYSDQTTETVTTYTLSGTLTEGTSTITVAYGGKTAEFDVVVTVGEYSVSNGLLTQVIGGTVVDTNSPGNICYQSDNTARHTFYIDDGEKPVVARYTWEPTEYYPIPVPPDATQVTVSITPNTWQHGEAFYTYENGEYTRTLDPGWKTGSFTHTITAGAVQFLTVVSRSESEATDLVVTFA